MPQVENRYQLGKRKLLSRMSFINASSGVSTDNRAKQTGTEESGKFHFIPYLQDIDRDTGRDYAL
jgi:hypothetical protein